MKLALIAGANSATRRVLDTLAPLLRALGAEVDRLDAEAVHRGRNFAEYDLVHFGYLLGLSPENAAVIAPPITGNVWHLAAEHNPRYAQRLIELTPARIFVDDVITLQGLGQMGFTEVTLVPLVFDPSAFSPLPPPPGPFTVGAFGDDYPSKRFEVIREGCKLAGVDFFDAVQDRHERIWLLDPIQDVYAHVHAMAHASFHDTNFLPGLEALACGRPILSVHNYGIDRVLSHGTNGLFYDGSPRDLAGKICRLQDHYASYRRGVERTTFPLPTASARSYFDAFQRILLETQPDDTPDHRLQNLLLS